MVHLLSTPVGRLCFKDQRLLPQDFFFLLLLVINESSKYISSCSPVTHLISLSTAHTLYLYLINTFKMKYAFAALALAATAFAGQWNGTVVYTTDIVTAYTTYCPEATTVFSLPSFLPTILTNTALPWHLDIHSNGLRDRHRDRLPLHYQQARHDRHALHRPLHLLP